MNGQSSNPFKQDFEVDAGQEVTLRDGLTRIVAPNASSMTFTGTNTYLLGFSEIAVIDPGPEDDDHFHSIMKATARRGRITVILVTHAHHDHCGLASKLSAATGAPVLAHRRESSDPAPNRGSLPGKNLGGGEGIDQSFSPDRHVADGETVSSGEWSLQAIWTPGHASSHLCFSWREVNVLFSGDHIMGWSTTLVSPPDGHMGDFRKSIMRLQRRSESVYYPGHGDSVDNPQGMLGFQLNHRQARELEILHCLRVRPAGAKEIARSIYVDLPPNLLPAAARNVLAHLIDLHDRGEVATDGKLSAEAVFHVP